MVRFGFTLFLLLHGLIHLLGFVKNFQLTAVKQIASKTLFPLSADGIKMVGLFWLLTCTLFLFATVIFLLKKDWWGLPGALAVLCSQLLIFLYWPDAKFGTIANCIVAMAIAVAYGNWRFDRMVQQELSSFTLPPELTPELVTPDKLLAVPPVIQKWLNHTNCVGKEMAHTVWVQQKGEMRIKPDGKWMPFKAEQHFRVDKPAFLWQTQVNAAPLVQLTGRDKYLNGHGHMLIQLLALLPVANAQGPQIDQGTLLRYLAEIVWFPSAALQPYISWEEIDATTARATMHYGGIRAAGEFKFNPAGDVISFTAQRYYDRPQGATLEKWLVTIDETSFREFAGIRVPTKSALTWKLASGDFTWFMMEITSISYNAQLPSKRLSLNDRIIKNESAAEVEQ